ncbi:peptide chain release factor N(5)-glutamine methyltransferase [Weeksella virosa]|uniref:peptide chain release factor N(5)-glutamine methyltransferase n=1 Tax=Weeksella virosa (strain ATCC 43766 / DSM 16922 / JCM 21250 / CCUG 30538 / CDC 9751 / IAM 14551 / NBRC 16016 / NCTC 11634 / CL345/78) TaxID=865938 RepID=F0NXC6_WEEVC|nr:peptide chain release factor N(5)-glutamine methyltransferase [Weeksella virosa]ADX66900.1 protein-(glutamine-N5) methyltransferase, release factor-specific [Weeksella virosa DSM 16922]MDK7674887.1 peptide chain release factor N(5)-glutamine methyltransferase [Weeksella virosa]VEH63373.1 Release factor glutamine methyltransferase [Weeksella virosa]
MNLAELEKFFVQSLSTLYDEQETKALFRYYLEEKYHFSTSDFLLPAEHIFRLDEIENDVVALSLGKPIQQILGYAYFMDWKFLVNEFTLIPRPETEELVEWIAKDLHKRTNELRVLDIGTGSGCIPIALKHLLPNAQISAIDFSAQAIAMAKKNAKYNKVEVDFFVHDIFDKFPTEKKYDVLVSNPPYVRNCEKEAMHQNVLNFEPETALFVADDNPLKYYQRIIEVAKEILTAEGVLYLEINQYLSQEMTELYSGDYEYVELRKDLSGHYRMLKASNQKNNL